MTTAVRSQGATVPSSTAAYIADLRPERGVHIAGARTAAADGSTFAVTDKATGDVLCRFADGGPGDASAAVDAAAASSATWSATSPRARSECLYRAHQLMNERIEDLAALISAENGKSLADARSEVAYAAEFFRWYAEEAVRSDGDFAEAPTGGARTLVRSRPVGIAALVTPWNFPAAMVTRKLGPALAAGCTTVVKAAVETPLTALAVVDILEQAGVPAGVVNIVIGTDAAAIVSAWLADPRIRKISFTGSTRVGQLLLRQAADRVVVSSMELGGNAPFVVAADADVPAAVAGAMIAKFRNAGQACTAANRFYVHEAVADEFIARFGERIGALRTGSAFETGTEVGPMISASAVDRLRSTVARSVEQGARISHQGALPALPGTFFPPTLLTDVNPTSDILTEEIFGPVAPVVTWNDEAELLKWVNDTELGLASYVYSGDLRWALTFAERIEAGMVGINRGIVSDPSAPFGGLKQSGIGREGARDGLREFTETQYFSIDWT